MLAEIVVAVVEAALAALAAAGLYREALFWRAEERFEDSCKEAYVVVPLRGVHPALEENLKALAAEGRALFVVDDASDPAYPIAARYGEVIVAGSRSKSEALAKGLEEALRRGADCVVFADDDIRPGPRWLKGLTAPLSRHEAATTYRWYVGGGLCTRARAAVSNTAFAAMQDPRSRFLWGGSTALRRDVVERGKIAERLPRYISDDYATYSAVKEMGGSIWFSRESIAPTPDPDCRWRDMFRWAVRQILMVKWYAKAGWRVGLAIYTLNFAFGVAAPAAGLALGMPLLALGFSIPLINLAKDFVRARGG
ncbi:MAG: glycosyltransferase [Thermoproteus sp. AZ2]|uniref:Glycosyltransferase n=1 Tax=Thermoproteus sp. AZ2 TaxID=1609232 RepID=A0ACC6UYK4_9CREN